MSTAIQAVIFDFGQTLVDSADGFRRAEKEAQERLFAGLALSLREPFLENYRRIRSPFHGRSDLSRRAMCSISPVTTPPSANTGDRRSSRCAAICR